MRELFAARWLIVGTTQAVSATLHHRADPRYWIRRFGCGVLLILLAGTGMVARVFQGGLAAIATVGAGFVGFYLAFSAIQPLARFAARAQARRQPWSTHANDQFADASLPRRVFYLLTAVASVDGPVSEAERAMVRSFVFEHFLDRVSQVELVQWERQPLQVNDLRGLAARVAVGLSEAEIDTLFLWSALVAFADGKFEDREHGVLQQIATAFGLQKVRARMLFHAARVQWLNRQQQRSARPTAPVDARAHALSVLGLPANATADQIRKRHRELVRRFHPDAQPNLGPVAQREATERFQEIQRAYETLTN